MFDTLGLQAGVSDGALVYGTKLYTDWGAYKGDPVPYVGNGEIAYNKKTGKPAGHCMLIIGYDDARQALLIQNSQGAGWGQRRVCLDGVRNLHRAGAGHGLLPSGRSLI